MADHEYSAITIANYNNRIKTFTKKFPTVDTRKPEDVYAALQRSDYAPASYRAFLVAFSWSYKQKGETEIVSKYTPFITTDAREELGKLKKQEFSSEREKKNYVPWDEILKIAADIRADPAFKTEDKLLVSFYTTLPPARVDYLNLAIHRTAPAEDVGNYIVINPKKPYVKINEHKTAKTHGPIMHTLPVRLLAQTLQYLLENPSVTTLFESNEIAMSKRVIRIFRRKSGKNIGVNILRHAYITKMREGDMRLLHKIDMAKSMGHTVMHQELYRRVDDAAAGAAGGAGAS